MQIVGVLTACCGFRPLKILCSEIAFFQHLAMPWLLLRICEYLKQNFILSDFFFLGISAKKIKCKVIETEKTKSVYAHINTYRHKTCKFIFLSGTILIKICSWISASISNSNFDFLWSTALARLQTTSICELLFDPMARIYICT